MTPIETAFVSLLSIKGPIRGTAQVDYTLWPERSMQPRGAALAAGKVIRGVRHKGYVNSFSDNKLSSYEVTKLGLAALEADRLSAIDTRQLSNWLPSITDSGKTITIENYRFKGDCKAPAHAVKRTSVFVSL
jgi:hypothetical protein